MISTMCAEDPAVFASIALNHALNDTNVSLATPRHVMIGFEFDMLPTPASRAKITRAFCSEVTRRSMALGKCHSSMSSGRTAVTLAVLATNPVDTRPPASEGSRIIGEHVPRSLLTSAVERGEEPSPNAVPRPSSHCWLHRFLLTCGLLRSIDVSRLGAPHPNPASRPPPRRTARARPRPRRGLRARPRP